MFRSVAFGKREAAHATGGKFQHGGYGLRRANARKREWRCFFDDLHNLAFAVEKDHVQRQVGIFHPHDNLLRRIVQKEHAVLGGKPCAEHETAALLGGRSSDLDADLVACALARMQQQRLRGLLQTFQIAFCLRGGYGEGGGSGGGGGEEEEKEKARQEL